MDSLEVFEAIKRDCTSMISESELLEKLQSGNKLKIKLGADPSRPDLHLGHSVVLRKLRLLQQLGHEIIFVVGDFTGMIGDPSGKSKTRQPLTLEQTRENGRSYFEQVTKILDKEKTSITYNSEWLSKLNFADVLKLAGKSTVARIMERDDFAKRYSENSPIGLHELFYPLMQAYDSVALNADIEVGGSDQTFNLLMGRDIQRSFGQTPQDIITFPILPGIDGVEKMSKSLNNYIGIDEPPAAMYEKCMKVEDGVLEEYFRLTTDIQEAVYKKALKDDVRQAHFMYADEIAGFYCGERAAKKARERYMEIASGKIPHGDIRTVTLCPSEMTLIELVKEVGFASSNSEARRLIQGRGIKVGSEVADAPDLLFDGKSEIILSKGKSRFVKVIFKGGKK